MATPSMQVCMETSDWLKGIVAEDHGAAMDSSTSSPSGDLIAACSRQMPTPPMDRRLRPPHDHALKCPRCDSTHTKFCYYNNYSLSQPRYFCKTCRRYWTKGGSLRNVPVGGGCRKNKRPATAAAKKTAAADHQFFLHHHHQHPPHLQPLSSFHDHGGTATDLHLSFSGMQLPHLDSLPESTHRSFNFADFKYNSMLESSAPNGLELIVGTNMSSSHGYNGPNSFGFDGAFAEAYQRLALPFGGQEEDPNAIEVKPVGNWPVLSLDWQDQGCNDIGSCGTGGVGYSGTGLGFWATAGMINGNGSSAAI